MKCHSLRDAIVEQARGGVAGPGTAAAIESHLDHCASCAALMTRERQLSQGLRALAASTAADAPSDALERRLLGAFAERQAARPSATMRARSWRWAGAAAAALIVGASGAWWWSAVNESEVVNTQPAVAEAPERAQPPTAAPTPVADGRSAQAAGGGVRTRAARRPAPLALPIVRATGFTAIPGADGLPDFESGEIIRAEIPLASLPTYGIDIQPDAQGSPVEADLLVGQDGQPRAIRLVHAGAGS